MVYSVSMTPAQRRRFAELRAAREANRIERSRIARWTERLVRDAHKAGATPTVIAREAGVTRQTVHNILKEHADQ